MVRLSTFHDPCPLESEAHFQRFVAEDVLRRLRALDNASLDSADPLVRIGTECDNGGRITKNSYGVFNLAWQADVQQDWGDRVCSEVQDLRKAIKQTHGVPLKFLIWAGMGGSIEDKSMYQSIGLLRRGPRFYALDSTDPAKLKYILEDMRRRSGLQMPALLRSTLVVGMAMGMTSYEPVVNLEKLAALYDRYSVDSRPNFLYMTLPGSLLDQFAGPRGYRKVELQLDSSNSTAGRHSGPLTRGSLYPLGLAGTDLGAWIKGCILSQEEIETALRLAAFLHGQGEEQRDKVTLLLPRPWAGAALWTKQDFEESLGKSEQAGIKIVIGEAPLGQLSVAQGGEPGSCLSGCAGEENGGSGGGEGFRAAAGGLPGGACRLPAGIPLSRYMQFMHYIVFGLGYLRNMNFVTQPSVELYKSIANRLHAEAAKAGSIELTRSWTSMTRSPRQARWRGALTLFYDGMDAGTDDGPAPQIYAMLLKKVASARQVEMAS